MPIAYRSAQISAAVFLALTLIVPASGAAPIHHAARKPVLKEGLVAYWPGDGDARDLAGKVVRRQSMSRQSRIAASGLEQWYTRRIDVLG